MPPIVFRWLVGAVIVVTLLASGTAALASTKKPLYRTTAQAAHFLRYGLRHWAHDRLGRPSDRAAFCVSGYSAWPERDEHYPQKRVNRSGTSVYRTFACTLYAPVEGHVRVFGLHLLTTHSGWRVTAL